MTGPRSTLIHNATLIDGTITEPRPGIDVRIEDGRIAEIGRDLAPGTSEAVDATGLFLTPGLIDCHVHFVLSGGPDDDSMVRASRIPAVAWAAARNAAATLAGGVTTARDLGAKETIGQDLRDEIRAVRLPGPRIRAAGQVICMTGGHGWWMAREADGVDGVRKAVRAEIKAGADAIKFIATGGVMTPRVDPRSPQLDEDELRAGVEAAHAAFVRVAAHAQATDGIKNAVRAGVDSIEHGVFLDDEAIEMMRERGTFLVPTLAAPANISANGLAAGIPAFMVEKSDRVRETHVESFKKALRAGVRIAMGTDAGTPFNLHGNNAQELRLMVEAGMTPGAALVAATRDAADLLDVAAEAGTIETGKAADLLLLSADPLVNINAVAAPARVMARGLWVNGG